MHTFTKKEFLIMGGAFVLLVPALLINLDMVPLYAEEPRRAVVAMEMIFRNNWIIPTIHGDFYFLKPPFYNWILATLYTASGTYSEFITRLPTVVSLLLLGLVIYQTGKRYVDKSFGALTALLFMISAGNLFFNSLLAEIDMFYSLVTYTSLVCLFHFHQQKQYYKLFLSVYFLGAIGVLTKGAPSLVYTGLSILVYFIFNKEFKKLFTLPHFLGIALFLLIVGSYFYFYSRQGDTIFYFQNLSSESSKRFSGYTLWEYIVQILIYPFDTMKDLLPGSLLLIFTIRKSFIKIIRSNPFIRFSFLMLALHFPIYWLPPGSRQRYIIMLYPFLLQIPAYFYLLFIKREPAKEKVLNVILLIATGLFALVALVPLFIPKLSFINGLPWICGISFLVLASIIIIQLKHRRMILTITILAMVVLRITFDFLILPIRSQEGKAYSNKTEALQLEQILTGKPVGVYRSTYFPMQCTYYMERERQQIIPVLDEVRPAEYYIVQQILLEDYNIRRDLHKLMENPLKPFSDPLSWEDTDIFSGYNYQVIHEFYLQKRKYLLIIPIPV